jgi:hypothetical protein
MFDNQDPSLKLQMPFTSIVDLLIKSPTKSEIG